MNQYQDQTIMHGDGSVGDCFRACVATIIGRKTLGVPHFALLGDLHAMETAVAWLNLHGYEVDIHSNGYDEEGFKPEPLHIISGVSPRGIPHAVVGDTETGKIVHDPHPSRGGLERISSRLFLFKAK